MASDWSGGRELQIMVGVSSKVTSKVTFKGAEDTTASPDQSSYDCISRSAVSSARPTGQAAEGHYLR